MQRIFAALIVLGLVAAACSDAGEPAADDPPASSSSTTSSTTSAAPSTTGALIPRVSAPDPDPTPLPTDPDLRIGTLDNGLTYYLRSNDAPGSSLDLRLVVDAGSLQQETPDAGTAHFLEHMLFNGTEQFPGNELDRSLQRLGIQFGPELNAFTSYDETVYLLGATTLDPSAVEIAFDVLAQWASAATLEPDAVADEVGVVREELRQRRETSDGIIAAEFDDIYTAGTVYEGRSPIGSEEGVESTTTEPLREYYDRWYRPDNMAVVVVGDLPVDRMEEEIRSRFGDLRPPAAGPVPEIDRTVDLVAEPSGHVVTHPGQAVDNLSFDIPLTVWDTGTVGGERLTIMEDLIADMITNRLDDAFVRGELALTTAPFLLSFEVNRGLRFFGTNFQADDITAGIDDLMSTLLGPASAGFTADDVARAVDRFGAGLDNALSGLDSRQDRQFASAYADNFLRGSGIDAVSATVERQRDLIATLTAEELTDHWRWILQVGGPIVIAVGSDRADLPTPEELVAAVDEATAVGDAATTATIDRLMAPPDPVDPIDTETVRTPLSESTTWTFDNGARVVHLFSEVATGRVDLLASANGGWSLLDDGGALTAVVTAAVDDSGLGDIDPIQLSRYLGGVSAELGSYIDETEEGFFGGASTEDTEVLFQLLHLAITEPRVDETAIRTAINLGRNQQALAESDPATRAILALIDARTGGDARYSIVPTESALDELTADAALEAYVARLGDVDDLVIVVVGDIDRDIIDDLARRYVGTLPAGAPDTWIDRLPPMPAGVIRREIPLSNDVTAAGIDLLYSVDISIDAELEVTARVLEIVLTTRILDTVREDLGASYGGSASVLPTRRPRESVDVVIDVGGDPDRLEAILATIDRQIAELVDDGPSADEFDRAVAILASDYEFIDNGLFLDAALDAVQFPDADRLDPFERSSMLDRVSVDDVRKLAFRLFPPDQRIEIVRTTS